jgi:predicted acyltransferase
VRGGRVVGEGLCSTLPVEALVKAALLAVRPLRTSAFAVITDPAW